MARYNLGGTRLGALRLGRWSCIRQQMLRPSDSYDMSLSGVWRLGVLREQEAIPIEVKIFATVTPVRWLWPGYVAYVTADHTDSSSLVSPPVYVANTRRDLNRGFAFLGIGDLHDGASVYRMYLDNYLRVYNEYLKWPEDGDATLAALEHSSHQAYGLRAVLPEAFDTRFRRSIDNIDEDRTVSVATAGLRIQDLIETSAKLRLGLEREWLTSGRYMETMREYFGGSGSHEVDQVPIDYGGPSGWMTAENIWATDGAQLGAVRAVHQWRVDHRWGRVDVPEHSIWAIWLCVRPQRLLEDMVSPTANAHNQTRAEFLGLDQLMETELPKSWVLADYVSGSPLPSGSVGLAPFGHQWRSGWDQVDLVVQERAFMTQKFEFGTNYCPVEYPGFVSASLGNGIFRCHVGIDAQSNIHMPLANVMAGANIS